MLDIKDIGNGLNITGVLWGGNSGDFLIMLPNESPPENLDIIIVTTNRWEEIIRQSDVVDVEVFRGNQKVILRKTTRQIDAEVSWAVFRRDGFVCRYCGKERPLTVDHIITWEAGGPSTANNLVSSCKKCNRTRGNTLIEEFLESEYYIRVSRDLTPQQKRDNLLLRDTTSIDTVNHIRSR